MGTRQVFNDYYAGLGRLGLWGGAGAVGGAAAWGYDGPCARRNPHRIDLFDAKSRKPIWHAAVSQSVSI
jgi:hypothetical protein